MLHHAADEYHLNDLVITYHEAPYYVYYYFIKLPLFLYLLAGSSVIMEEITVSF